MAPVGPSFFTVSDRPPASRGGLRSAPSSSGFGASTTFRLIARYAWYWRAPSPSTAPD